MTQLALQLAAMPDHWFHEPQQSASIRRLSFGGRHFSKQHPVIADGLEWSACGVIAVAIIFGSLIANA
jgi:hypothetical protein